MTLISLWSRRLLLLLLIAGPLRAQPADAPAPLYLWAAGDLYALSPGQPLVPPVRLTTNGLITDPAAAPDRSAVAYRLPAPLALAALGTLPIDGLIAEYDLPMDLALIRPDGTMMTLAAQPDGALFDGTSASTALVRSAPVWSPDGGRIAWIEYPFGAARSRIVAHAVASGASAVLIDGVPVAGARAPILRWGRAGLLVGAANAQNGLDLIAYALDGAPVFAARFIPPAGRSIQTFDWVQGVDPTDDRVGVLGDDGVWLLLEADGTARPASVVRVTETPGSRRLAFGYLPDFGWYWSALDPLDPLAAAVDFPAPPERTALSPDGRFIASIGYPDAGGVGLWTADGVIAVPGTGADGLYVGGLLWGRLIWQIDG
jgi:hypothetical protein